MKDVIIIEPFCEGGGSHQQFIEILKKIFQHRCNLYVYTQKATKV